MRRLVTAAFAVALSGCSDHVTGPSPTTHALSPLAAKSPHPPVVHIVYLVPSDVRVRRDYVQNLRDAAVNLQAWYSDALGIGETFTLANPTVEVYRTERTVDAYATTPVAGADPSMWFWLNATGDGFAATGGGFNDPDDVWVFYIDALPGCGQATGGAASVALLPANDLRGLAGEATIDPCTGQVEPTFGPCRWVGGLGHELGHALGLPHPAGCESGSSDCPTNALMWFGYLTYPNTFLTANDQAILGQSAFIAVSKLPTKIPSCESIGSSGVTAFEATQRLRANFDRAAALGACPYRTLLAAAR